LPKIGAGWLRERRGIAWLADNWQGVKPMLPRVLVGAA